MKCFYHGDKDGECAGFWVYLSAGLYDGYEADIKFLRINYGMDFPFNDIKENEQVYIVDYSISPDEMRRLLTITKDVTWIDHHKTAIAKYKDFEYNLRGVRYDGVAGCMLTYCYLHHMTERGQGEIKPFDLSMTKDAPMFTKLLADYDVWTFEFGDDTRYFQTGVNSYDFEPENKRWYDLLDDGAEKIYIEEGKTMIKYRDNWAKDYCKCKGFETEFEGHKCYVMNLGLCGSDYFKSIDDGSYEILIAFSYNGKDWSISLYSKTVDVSEIAKKYGGGGHRGASGFNSDALLFKRIEI
jgi:oligoribonuclease NrnB/cAMP/cGMP phosphodiesterase (DHH superfamily)